MIHIWLGNIFDAPAEALVNPVNCVGAMGKGLALEFKKRFPDYFDDYRQGCKAGNLRLCQVGTYRSERSISNQWIFSFPTKFHWQDKSEITSIVCGLATLVAIVRQNGIKSIAIPALGCGLGGLKWADVHPLIERAFQTCLPECEVFLCPPQ